jgi:hypothetical protein
MSRTKIWAVIVLGLISSFPCYAKKPTSISDSELSQITLRGRVLYEYDQAAWHATDAVQDVHPAQQDVGRYIARKTDEGWNVAFGHLDEKRDAFLISYLALQGSKPQEFSVQHYAMPKSDTGFYLASARAIDLALSDFKGEQRPYNVAVLPATGDQLYVYVLPAQTKNRIYPLGGDVRYLISADGNSILETRHMHHSVLDFDMNSPDVAKMTAGFHVHVLSDVPEDSDVFFVLTRRPAVPEYIMIDKKMRYIILTDGSITILK